MNAGVTFRPSQVELSGIPLVGTLDKTEIEIAAAMLIRTLQVRGDEWKPVAWLDVSAVLRADDENKLEPFHHLIRNPFARPDFPLLVERGFARKIDDPNGGTAFQLELLPVALERIQKWVRA